MPDLFFGNTPANQTFSSAGPSYSAQNTGSLTMLAGQPVRADTTGYGVRLADATAIGRAAIGLLLNDLAPGQASGIQVNGLFALDDWTTITGTQLLTPMTNYWLDTAAGRLTITVPLSGVCQLIGRTMTTTTLKVDIGIPILL